MDDKPITETLCRERMAAFASLLEHSLKDMAASSADILHALDTLNNQLFKDNGGISLQTRVDRNTRQAAAAVKLTWIALTFLLTSIIGLVTFFFKYMMKP